MAEHQGPSPSGGAFFFGPLVYAPIVSAPVVIVCPLRYEAGWADRAAAGRARVVVSGPGNAAAAGAVEHAVAAGSRRLVLFGTCGGLRKVEPCPSIGTVVDERGESWALPGGVVGAARLLNVDSPLASPREKHEAHERTGADLVDCESAGFAGACTRAGVDWRVVRAVSDTWDEALPEGVGAWVTAQGSTRFGRIALDCLTRPQIVPGVVRLSKRSGAALRLASERLDALLREWEGGTP